MVVSSSAITVPHNSSPRVQLSVVAVAQSNSVLPLGNMKDAQMWSCFMICGTNKLVSYQFVFSLCTFMETGWKDGPFWMLTYKTA